MFISYQRGKEIQKKFGLDTFIECSAKTNSNIKESFECFYKGLEYLI